MNTQIPTGQTIVRTTEDGAQVIIRVPPGKTPGAAIPKVLQPQRPGAPAGRQVPTPPAAPPQGRQPFPLPRATRGSGRQLPAGAAARRPAPAAPEEEGQEIALPDESPEAYGLPAEEGARPAPAASSPARSTPKAAPRNARELLELKYMEARTQELQLRAAAEEMTERADRAASLALELRELLAAYEKPAAPAAVPAGEVLPATDVVR